MSIFDKKKIPKDLFWFSPFGIFWHIFKIENYNWKNFSEKVVETTTSWMTLNNNFSSSFHQVFVPLMTSQSSSSISLRPQNHKKVQFDSEGVGAPQSPTPAPLWPSRGPGDTAPDRPGTAQGRAGLGVSAEQHKEHSYSSLPTQCSPSHIRAEPLLPPSPLRITLQTT